MADSTSTSHTPERLPPQGVRTVVSFLIFVHLFALLVAVASNARPVSPLRSQLGAVPGVKPYLQLLNMDLAYNYQLTYGDDLDFDHILQVEVDWRGSSAPGSKILSFPEDDLHGLRRRHYRNLMFVVASRVASQDEALTLPRAIAARLLRENAIAGGSHRISVVRHAPLEMADVGSPDPQQRDPYAARLYTTIYEADARFYQNELIVVPAASALETAPAEKQPDSPRRKQ